MSQDAMNLSVVILGAVFRCLPGADGGGRSSRGSTGTRSCSLRRKGGTITFLEFARVGVPLTIVNGTVYWLFLKYM